MELTADTSRTGTALLEHESLAELAPLVDELRRAAESVTRLAMTIEACIERAEAEVFAPHIRGRDAHTSDGPAAVQLVGHPVTSRRLVGPVAVHGFHVDPGRHTVRLGDRTALLTPNEWQLFALMLAEPGRTLSREELATGAWGRGYGGRDSEVEVYISRLRRKLEADPRSPLMIETVRGCGYRLVPPDEDVAVAPDVAMAGDGEPES